jgi:hypothetical protein
MSFTGVLDLEAVGDYRSAHHTGEICTRTVTIFADGFVDFNVWIQHVYSSVILVGIPGVAKLVGTTCGAHMHGVLGLDVIPAEDLRASCRDQINWPNNAE